MSDNLIHIMNASIALGYAGDYKADVDALNAALQLVLADLANRDSSNSDASVLDEVLTTSKVFLQSLGQPIHQERAWLRLEKILLAAKTKMSSTAVDAAYELVWRVGGVIGVAQHSVRELARALKAVASSLSESNPAVDHLINVVKDLAYPSQREHDVKQLIQFSEDAPFLTHASSASISRFQRLVAKVASSLGDLDLQSNALADLATALDELLEVTGRHAGFTMVQHISKIASKLEDQDARLIVLIEDLEYISNEFLNSQLGEVRVNPFQVKAVVKEMQQTTAQIQANLGSDVLNSNMTVILMQRMAQLGHAAVAKCVFSLQNANLQHVLNQVMELGFDLSLMASLRTSSSAESSRVIGKRITVNDSRIWDVAKRLRMKGLSKNEFNDLMLQHRVLEINTKMYVELLDVLEGHGTSHHYTIDDWQQEEMATQYVAQLVAQRLEALQFKHSGMSMNADDFDSHSGLSRRVPLDDNTVHALETVLTKVYTIRDPKLEQEIRTLSELEVAHVFVRRRSRFAAEIRVITEQLEEGCSASKRMTLEEKKASFVRHEKMFKDLLWTLFASNVKTSTTALPYAELRAYEKLTDTLVRQLEAPVPQKALSGFGDSSLETSIPLSEVLPLSMRNDVIEVLAQFLNIDAKRLSLMPRIQAQSILQQNDITSDLYEKILESSCEVVATKLSMGLLKAQSQWEVLEGIDMKTLRNKQERTGYAELRSNVRRLEEVYLQMLGLVLSRFSHGTQLGLAEVLSLYGDARILAARHEAMQVSTRKLRSPSSLKLRHDVSVSSQTLSALSELLRSESAADLLPEIAHLSMQGAAEVIARRIAIQSSELWSMRNVDRNATSDGDRLRISELTYKADYGLRLLKDALFTLTIGEVSRLGVLPFKQRLAVEMSFVEVVRNVMRTTAFENSLHNSGSLSGTKVKSIRELCWSFLPHSRKVLDTMSYRELQTEFKKKSINFHPFQLMNLSTQAATQLLGVELASNEMDLELVHVLLRYGNMDATARTEAEAHIEQLKVCGKFLQDLLLLLLSDGDRNTDSVIRVARVMSKGAFIEF
jgi:ElaB/YqjD/DUF883 family membrane-anchored ribosome-binding protein